MTARAPVVSICIPTYNSADFLATTLASVVAQRFDDLEIVVCDDASTDHTHDVVDGIGDRRIRHVRAERRGGQARNFNRCLAEARGQFVTLLHADDYFLDGFIADRVDRLTRQPELSCAFGAVQLVDAAGRHIGVSGAWRSDRAFESRDLVIELLHGSVVSCPSLMVRRAVAMGIGPFRTDITWGHDWEWHIRLAETGPAAYSAVPLAAYRVHDASGTADALNAGKNGPQERRVLQETLARLVRIDAAFATQRRSAFRALGRRHMYHAHEALLADRTAVAQRNLWYAALAYPALVARPTFVAILVASFSSRRVYRVYHRFREGYRATARA